MNREPAAPPWWWLTLEERERLGLGEAVARTSSGFVFGDPGAPYRIELGPRDESAPVKLGSVSLRLLGDGSRADARRAIYEASRALYARRGRGFDPAAIELEAAGATSLAIIDVPSICDRACAFCHRALQPIAARRPRGSDEDVIEAIDRAESEILFTGDDALSHPRIVEWIARAAARGPVSLIGPARPGLAPRLAPALARAGLARFSSGLFGSEPSTHDRIAGREGALAALAEACAALRGVGIDVELVTPLVRALLADLPAISARARAWSGREPSLLAYVPDTEVGVAFDGLVAPWDELRAALEALGDRGPRADALPLCVLPARWRRGASARLERTDRTLAIVHPEDPCGRCAARAACPGIATTVLRAVGVGGLRAIGSDDSRT